MAAYGLKMFLHPRPPFLLLPFLASPLSVAEVAAFAPAAVAAAVEEAVLAPLVEPPELFCLRVFTVRDFSSVAHGLAEPGIAHTALFTPARNEPKNVLTSKFAEK